MRAYAGDVAFLSVVAALLVVGAWASQVTGRALGAADHGCIVIDEVAAFLLVLFFTGVTPLRIALAFALFRLFDIVKPPPIRQLDAALKNGVGVMVDDLMAAVYALLVFAVGQRCWGSRHDHERGIDGLDLRRVEEVSLNALQTQRQLFYDGWLLRVSPGKARRARSVTAHFGSTLPVAARSRIASGCTPSAGCRCSSASRRSCSRPRLPKRSPGAAMPPSTRRSCR